MPSLTAYYCDTFELPLPSGHRFPLAKYRQLRQRVAAELGAYVTLQDAPAATDPQLLTVHTEEYLAKAKEGTLTAVEQRRIGFPWSPAMLERSRRSTGATLAAARCALAEGIGLHLSGGTHHACADAGQGFCVFNDVAVATRVLQQEQQLERAVVIDLDVHQGNGTAEVFQHDPHVFTFSMHGERNFPFRKCAGNLDIALPDGTTDQLYLSRLAEALGQQVPLERTQLVFYIAGADPYHRDKFGRLALTRVGLGRRDRLVIGACRQLGVPLVIVMGGGYAPEISEIVAIHLQTVALAAELYGER